MTTATRHRLALVCSGALPTKGPYAPVPYCNDHHTYAKGCNKCRRYGAWHKRVHALRVENGERITVPIAEVRTHLDKLTSAGMTPKAISEASGVKNSTLKGPLYKDRGWVAGWVAEKILAVPVPTIPVSLPPNDYVTDATGTVRRIRALARIGWTYTHIADAARTSRRIEHYAGQKWVTHEVAAAIDRAYDLLSMTPGPSFRTANRAAKAGWLPPLAWDDASLDDPAAQPAEAAADDQHEDYDPITVALAVDGRLTHEQISHRRADLIETVRRLAPRMSDQQIATHLRWPGAEDGPPGKTKGQGAVCQLRIRNGIPNHHTREVIAPTSTRDRARAARRHTKAA